MNHDIILLEHAPWHRRVSRMEQVRSAEQCTFCSAKQAGEYSPILGH